MVQSVEKILRDAGITDLTYSTGQVAKMFGKTRQWVLMSLDRGAFIGRDAPLTPERNPDGSYIWTAEDVKWIAVGRYQRNKLSMDALKLIIRRLIRDNRVSNSRLAGATREEGDDE